MTDRQKGATILQGRGIFTEEGDGSKEKKRDEKKRTKFG